MGTQKRSENRGKKQEHYVFMERSYAHISPCNTEPHSEPKLQNISFEYAPLSQATDYLTRGCTRDKN